MIFDYTDVSQTYDKYRSYKDSEIKRIVDFAEINEATRILDLGCGTGNVASQLTKLTKAKIIGIDKSIPMLKIAREKSLEVLGADMDNNQLPFRDQSFDIVMGTYVIHQINNLGFLFSECYRILRNGTLILLTSSHEQIERQHPVIKLFFPSFISIDKSRFPDIQKIDNLLSSAGFINIEHKELHVEDIPVDQDYLQKVKGKYVSTYHLLPPREFERGVKKLEMYIKNMSEHESREWRGTLVYGRKIT